MKHSNPGAKELDVAGPLDGLLNPEQQSRLRRVLAALATDEHAPTAIRAPEQAASAHVADSLISLELEPVLSAKQIADIGSGPGFPGIALAVALPGAQVALVESQRRKCDFLERLRTEAGIENALVVCSRAEQWRDGMSRNDVVVARALAPQPVVLEYAAPLLRVGGTLVDWRGKRDLEAERAGERAARSLGMRRVEVRKVIPFDGAKDRHLHVYAKVAETPTSFPRRAGVARKRPLGA